MNWKRISIIKILDELLKSQLDERGRIYIPKIVRDKIALKSGDKIYIKIEDESFIVFTRKAIKKRLVEVM